MLCQTGSFFTTFYISIKCHHPNRSQYSYDCNDDEKFNESEAFIFPELEFYFISFVRFKLRLPICLGRYLKLANQKNIQEPSGIRRAPGNRP